MAKFSFSYDDTRITIVDEKSKKVDDKLTLLEHVELSTAFRVLTAGRKADEKASDVAISMLFDVLQSPILDGYKGKTPHNEKVPSVFLSAVRDIENDVFKKAYVKAHTDRGATASKADQLWQEFRKAELSTGSYSNAKSLVCKMFAHMGQLPQAPNGKLLPLHAVRRMYESWKAEQDGDTGAKTIAQKLGALCDDMHNVNANIGELPEAIAHLRKMLATCELMYQLQLEQLTQQASGTSPAAQASRAVAKAAKVVAAREDEVAPV